MDAVQMLREDHRKVLDLFKQFEQAGDNMAKKGIVDTAIVELQMHSALEEEVFYPAVRKQGAVQLIDEAKEEHHTADMLMNELSDMSPGDSGYDAKFRVLAELVRTHVEEEEAEILPKAAEAGFEELQQLGQQMEKRRERLVDEMKTRRSRQESRNREREREREKEREQSRARAQSSNGSQKKTRPSQARTRGESRTRRSSKTKAGSRK